MAYVSPPFIFPFCIPDAAVTPPPLPFSTIGIMPWALGIDLDTLVKWYWRVKVWTVTLSGGPMDASASAGSASAASSASDTSMDPQERVDNPTESELVCSASGVRSWSGSIPGVSNSDSDSASDADYDYDVTTQTSSGFLNWSIFGNYSPGSNLYPVYFYDGLYYPRISTTLTATAFARARNILKPGGTGASGTIQQTTDRNLVSATATRTGFHAITVDGLSMDVPCFFNTVNSSSGTPLGSASASGTAPTITIEATEFFTYDPGDGGGPVWDGVTDAQLRDPFSIQSP